MLAALPNDRVGEAELRELVTMVRLMRAELDSMFGEGAARL